MAAEVHQAQSGILLDAIIDIALESIGIGDQINQAVAPAFTKIVAALVADGKATMPCRGIGQMNIETPTIERQPHGVIPEDLNRAPVFAPEDLEIACVRMARL